MPPSSLATTVMGQGWPRDRGAQIGLLIVLLVMAVVAVVGTDLAFSLFDKPKASPVATSTAASPPSAGVTLHWTDVTADRLAEMLPNKDFTLVDVKTPYIGEIDKTDLYIPYDQLKARAAELPADKRARILVYCRSGVQSAVAAQTLLDLGYTNVWNLQGGMNAWTASGRTLVNKGRS